MASNTPTRPPKPPRIPVDASPAPSGYHSTLTQPDGDSSPVTPRRSSFSFLRRKSSAGDRAFHRSTSGAKMSRKQKALAREEALRRQREAAMLPKQPPCLPSHGALPKIESFGGEGARPDSYAIISNRFGNHSFNFSRPSMDQHRMHPKSSPAMAPPVPGSSPSYMDYDPYPSNESMTHRGRYSYASSLASAINSPRRVRRRRDPTPFNILVIGAKGSGKSSFIDFLRTALALPAKKRPHTPSPPATAVGAESSPFTSEYIETEVDGERVGVTLWDSEGLEKNIVDFQLPIITSFVESKFEDTFGEELKVVRAPGAKDTHIHCVFLILDPARLDANIRQARKKGTEAANTIFGALDENLDLNVLRELQSKTTVVPIISKADTITGAHMRYLKKTVWETIKRSKLDPLEALNLDMEENEDPDRFDEREEDAYVGCGSESKHDALHKVLGQPSSEVARSITSSNYSKSPSSPGSSPSNMKDMSRRLSALSATMHNEEADSPILPLSIISPDPYDPDVVGRSFPWGFADPYNVEHCDFVKLRESVFGEWRTELREISRVQWYEGWRTIRLEKSKNRRRIVAADGPTQKQLRVPTANGRALNASGPDCRPERAAAF